MNKKLRIRRKSQKQTDRKIKFSFQECTICIDKFCNALIDGCQHQFCFQCIYKWSKKQNTCPTCRKEFKKIQSENKIVKIQENRTNSTNQSTSNILPPFRRMEYLRPLPMNFFYMPYQNQAFMGDGVNQFYNYSQNQLWNQPIMMNQNGMWPQFNSFIPSSNQFGSNFSYFPLNSFNNIQNYQSIENNQNAGNNQNIQNRTNSVYNGSNYPPNNSEGPPYFGSQFQ